MTQADLYALVKAARIERYLDGWRLVSDSDHSLEAFRALRRMGIYGKRTLAKKLREYDAWRRCESAGWMALNPTLRTFSRVQRERFR